MSYRHTILEELQALKRDTGRLVQAHAFSSDLKVLIHDLRNTLETDEAERAFAGCAAGVQHAEAPIPTSLLAKLENTAVPLLLPLIPLLIRHFSKPKSADAKAPWRPTYQVGNGEIDESFIFARS